MSGIMKKKDKIVRTWKVYDKSDELIFECESIKEILKKFSMRTTKPVYEYKNTGVYFNNNKKEKMQIRVDYVKKTAVKFSIPEDKRTPPSMFKVPGEIWRHIPGTPECNECSNKGRFRYKDDDGYYRLATLVKSMNKTKRTYKDFLVMNPGDTSYKIRTSRALAKTFIDAAFPLFYNKTDKLVVDHIDNDSLNENIENLRIVTQKENLELAYTEQNCNVSKRKKCYAKKGNDYREYNSTIELVKDITGKTNTGYFNSAIKRNGLLYGFEVGYLD